MLSPRARKLLLAAIPLISSMAAGARVEPLTPEEAKHFEGTLWFGVYIGPSKCGYAKEVFKRVEYEGRPAYRIEYDMLFKLNLMGRRQEIKTRDCRTFTERGALLRVEFSFDGPGGSQSSVSTIEGDVMKIVSTMGGNVTTTDAPAPRMTLGDQIGANLLIYRGTKPGEKIDATVYYPDQQKEFETKTEIGKPKRIMFNGVQTEVFEVTTLTPEMNITTKSWVTSEGVCLDIEQEFGKMRMRIRLEDEQQAKDIDYSHDLLNESVVKPDRHIADSTQCKRLKLRLSNLENDKLVLESDRMRYTSLGGGRYDVECKAPAFDGENAPPLPVAEPKMAKYLADDDLVQCKAPAIVAKAREIVGDEKDSWRAAKKINLWVYRNLEKVGTVAFSNALDTLQTMRGDCSEHSVLATALCRASGIPARQASGLVYWAGGRGFVGHQWFEVWVGRWVAMDAAFNRESAAEVARLTRANFTESTHPQDIADATHLMFAEGSLRDAVQAYGFFSKLKIEVLEAE